MARMKGCFTPPNSKEEGCIDLDIISELIINPVVIETGKAVRENSVVEFKFDSDRKSGMIYLTAAHGGSVATIKCVHEDIFVEHIGPLLAKRELPISKDELCAAWMDDATQLLAKKLLEERFTLTNKTALDGLGFITVKDNILLTIKKLTVTGVNAPVYKITLSGCVGNVSVQNLPEFALEFYPDGSEKVISVASNCAVLTETYGQIKTIELEVDSIEIKKALHRPNQLTTAYDVDNEDSVNEFVSLCKEYLSPCAYDSGVVALERYSDLF